MGTNAVRWYAWFSGVFLLLQGASTLAARWIPQVDQAVPALLATTQMVPAHSILHILTALLAFWAVLRSAQAAWWFALGFGLFYTGLGVIGWLTGAHLGLRLQPFDHPFHILLGALGLAAAGWSRARAQ